MVLLGLACFALSLWLVGVRDWRIYGVVALWPQFVGEMRVSHLTPVIMLLVAAAWRWRDTRGAPGVLVGLAVAIKFFVWPVGLWLAATRRVADAALAAAVAAFSLLLVLPFTGLHDYVDCPDAARSSLRPGQLQRVRPPGAGRRLRPGRARRDARRRRGCCSAATWRYRSLALALAAAFALSPIVWLDYFTLAALPLALARPRLSAIWFVPLVTWGAEGAGIGIGDVRTDVRVLVVFCVVLAVAFRGEPRDAGDVRPAM